MDLGAHIFLPPQVARPTPASGTAVTPSAVNLGERMARGLCAFAVRHYIITSLWMLGLILMNATLLPDVDPARSSWEPG